LPEDGDNVRILLHGLWVDELEEESGLFLAMGRILPSMSSDVKNDGKEIDCVFVKDLHALNREHECGICQWKCELLAQGDCSK
jgi:hypothetical protein